MVALHTVQLLATRLCADMKTSITCCAWGRFVATVREVVGPTDPLAVFGLQRFADELLPMGPLPRLLLLPLPLPPDLPLGCPLALGRLGDLDLFRVASGTALG